MAMNLFTSGPSVEDLLASRDKDALDLQRQLMKGAAQGARDPAKAQAVSFLGSSLGRALGASMGGEDKQVQAIKDKNAAQKTAQGQYVDGMGAPTAAGMREQAAILRNTYPEASLKLLTAANVKDKEEKDALAAEAAAAKQDDKDQAALQLAADIRAEDVKFKQDKIDLDADIRVEDKAEKLRKEGMDADAALAQATREDLINKKVVMTGAEWNAENGGSLAEGTTWLVSPYSGDMEKIESPDKKGNDVVVTTTIPEGMSAVYGDDGQITEFKPIKGGKQWIAAQELLADQEAAAGMEEGKASGRKIKNSVVANAIKSARQISDMDSLLTPIFGHLGLASVVGDIEGTERANMNATMKTLEAQSGFSTLQAMRDSSKTGGALGAINEKEMGLLIAALGTLDLSQTKEQFDQKLTEFEKVFYDTVNGSSNSDWKKQPRQGRGKGSGNGTQGGGSLTTMSQRSLKYVK